MIPRHRPPERAGEEQDVNKVFPNGWVEHEFTDDEWERAQCEATPDRSVFMTLLGIVEDRKAKTPPPQSPEGEI